MHRHASPLPPTEQLTVAEQVARREELQREKALACVRRNADLFRSNVSHEYIIGEMPELGRLPDHEADDLVWRRMTSPTSPRVAELGIPEEAEPADSRPANVNVGSSPRGDRTPRAPIHPGDRDFG